MAVLEILPYPNPFLREKAAPVEVFDAELQRLVRDMEETMSDAKGLGLAATQVGIAKRVLILDRYAFEGDDGRDKPNVVLINPEVVAESDARETGEEGCLSFPGVFIFVERPLSVTVRGQDASGQTFEIEGHGLGARAILHEMDHLEGVVMIDHVSHLQRQRALKKHRRNQQAVQEEGNSR